jgi:hypothetical protein
MENSELRSAQRAYEAAHESVSDMAITIGREKVIAQMDRLGDFIAGISTQREPSKFFTIPISNFELVQLLLGENAPDQERADAAKELRARYLAANQTAVMRYALEASI